MGLGWALVNSLNRWYLFEIANIKFWVFLETRYFSADVVHDMIMKGDIDPSDIITHVMPMEQASTAYDLFDKKEDNNIKFVLKP